MRVYWLKQIEKDVPPNDNWMCASEITCLNRLRFAKRRADWRLGRWTAKHAVAACLDWPTSPPILATIEIRATPGGAPEAVIANSGVPLVISLSHSAGQAICAVSSSGVMLGCDLEVIEPRSEAFVADYFTPQEQSRVARAPSAERPEIITLLWSAKESALKALQQGLRLDTRSVIVSPIEGAPDLDGWSPLGVACVDGRVFQGWWRTADGLLHTVVADPPPGCPICLTPKETSRFSENIVDLSTRLTMKPAVLSVTPP